MLVYQRVMENHHKIHKSLEFTELQDSAKGRCKLASGCWQTTHHPAKACRIVGGQKWGILQNYSKMAKLVNHWIWATVPHNKLTPMS